MEVEEQIRQAHCYLEARFGLDVLWVYGSAAKGTAQRRSDLDLAGFFRGRPAPEDVLDAAAELTGRLGREVDLVDLDRASPILAMQVLRHGRLLVDGDPRRRHAFFSRTVSLYEDLKIVRRPLEEALYRLRKMVGFRTIAIHEYQKLNPAIVQGIVERHLGDLRELGSGVLQRCGLGQTAP